jgi:hypothetical protein
MQKPIGGRSVLTLFATKSMLKKAAAGKREFKLFKREGVDTTEHYMAIENLVMDKERKKLSNTF